MTSKAAWPAFEGPCTLYQDDRLGEPIVLLRKRPNGSVKILTMQEAHALLDEYDMNWDTAHDYWWYPLCDLIEGIR